MHIFLCIFIGIMCYLICFGSDIFYIYLRGIVWGMISRFQSAKSSVHQATKVSRQNKRKQVKPRIFKRPNLELEVSNLQRVFP